MEFPLVFGVEGEAPQPLLAPTLEELKKPVRTSKVRPKNDLGYDPCSCVSFARWKTGINVGSIGVAKNHPVNSNRPIVGAIIVLYGGSTGHMGVVENFTDTIVTFNDCNNDYKCSCGIRTIDLTDKSIKGYYK